MNEDNIYNLQFGGELPLSDNMLDALTGGTWYADAWDGVKDTAQDVADSVLRKQTFA